MAQRRVGLWLIGAAGGVGCTTALGLAALARGLTPNTGVVTALPQFAALDLDQPGTFVVGGHDIRKANFLSAVRELHDRANVFDTRTIEACAGELEAWSANIRPGVAFKPSDAVTALADRTDLKTFPTPRAAIDQIQADLKGFVAANKLDQLVVVNAASTEPPFAAADDQQSLERLLPDRKSTRLNSSHG